MKNILLSTTRQWNPGDEFIRMGVSKLLSNFANWNPVIYNRSPAIHHIGEQLQQIVLKRYWTAENSFYLREKGVIDYVIFAGTPEWAGGYRSRKLFKFIIKEKLRCAFLGVGLAGEFAMGDLLKRVLAEHTDLVITRDSRAFKWLGDRESVFQSSCPAILASSRSYDTKDIKKIGCVVQGTSTRNQSIPVDVSDYLFDQYRKLSEHYEVEYIGHYFDDVVEGRRRNIPVRYSAFAEDYEDIFGACDLVIAPRIHACGLSSSMGIPNIAIAHDGRADAVNGFGSLLLQPNTELLNLVTETDWQMRASKIKELKQSAMDFYLDKLGSFCSEIS